MQTQNRLGRASWFSVSQEDFSCESFPTYRKRNFFLLSLVTSWCQNWLSQRVTPDFVYSLCQAEQLHSNQDSLEKWAASSKRHLRQCLKEKNPCSVPQWSPYLLNQSGKIVWASKASNTQKQPGTKIYRACSFLSFFPIIPAASSEK